MPKKRAVIGLGNTLRRDDGIGIEVLQSLLNSFKRKAVDYLNFGTASFDLIYRIENYDAVLLVDAIDASLKPGELRIFELNNIKMPFTEKPVSSHELDLKSLFELCEKFKIKTKIYVAGIQVEDISYKDGLSDKLKRRKESITREISSFIDKYLIP
ncbi:MAG: hydrogenase maturation protease [Candidatus Omnitrophica bacterium]|nr:hydrogenase maturation protease [Candidatus Omnitrophota bacterium]